MAAECRCTEPDRLRYERRLSRPMLERIDLVCQVSAPRVADLIRRDGSGVDEPSATVRQRVVAAREAQVQRLAATEAKCNADMDGPLTRAHAWPGAAARARLDGPAALGLSGRGYDRVLRLARTIADLAGRAEICAPDVDEALGYRLGPGIGVAA